MDYEPTGPFLRPVQPPREGEKPLGALSTVIAASPSGYPLSGHSS